MIKLDIINQVVNKTGITKTKAEIAVETVFAIIYPPQVAIVGLGRIMERPWSVEGRIVSRRVVTATLSADHRVTDGHRAGLFLASLERLLQEPENL